MSRWVLAATFVALISVACGFAAVSYLKHWAAVPLQPPDSSELSNTGAVGQRETTLALDAGESLHSFGNRLSAAGLLPDGLIDKQLLFRLYARFTGMDKRLQSGEYAISPELTVHRLLVRLTTGNVVSHTFRIHEGGTLRTMLAELNAVAKLSGGELSIGALELEFQQELQKYAAGGLEGLFFPDTYQFQRGDARSAVLHQAHEMMQRSLQEVWSSRKEHPHLQSEYELLILASIIEKETGRAEDRRDISQVFHNRLGKNMMLQTDPTVIYAVGATFDGNLTRAHLRMESPFNTYRNKGLTPTPIAFASLASIQAAANPTQGDLLYFVAKGDGTSHFSTTLAEHNAAVREYQLRRRH